MITSELRSPRRPGASFKAAREQLQQSREAEAEFFRGGSARLLLNAYQDRLAARSLLHQGLASKGMGGDHARAANQAAEDHAAQPLAALDGFADQKHFSDYLRLALRAQDFRPPPKYRVNPPPEPSIRLMESKPILTALEWWRAGHAAPAETGVVQDRQSRTQHPAKRMRRDRPLSKYLSRVFKEHLRELQADQTWLDVGAGECVAIAEFIKPGRWRKPDLGPKAIAVDLLSPRNLGGLRKSLGERFEFHQGNVRDAKIPSGSIDLLSDSYAGVAYDNQPVELLAKYHDLLKVGGVAHLRFIDGVGASEATTFLSESGERLTMLEWLRSLRGFRVELPGGAMPTGTRYQLDVSLTKTDEPFSAPPVEMLGFGTLRLPPTRVFATDL